MTGSRGRHDGSAEEGRDSCGILKASILFLFSSPSLPSGVFGRP